MKVRLIRELKFVGKHHHTTVSVTNNYSLHLDSESSRGQTVLTGLCVDDLALLVNYLTFELKKIGVTVP